ncbi:FkbM family methyltransferase [Magnetospirillum fulvum]|uniref:Methyltransferase, FkbM family n=1 Tax=Magnetospirillum fulvum TaxID=1082 RepID=A0A1H6H386_MAGFU|nr:FkbM family methyltransferase [Magnetospirillum fulvum]SEH30139.1 methyltransferase, FkbM family [Magnetospirillum fulvum]
MSDQSDLKNLYLAFEAVRADPQAGPALGELLTLLGARLHSPGQKQIGEFTIGDVTYRADLVDRFGRACVYGGHQERDDLELFLGLCDETSVVWDIGANFGLYTVATGRKIGPEGAVFAAEPNRNAMVLLRENVERNGVVAQLLPLAIADFDGTATFYEAQESAFSGLSDAARSAVASTPSVEVRRLDGLWRKQGCRPIDLIKIDVEGHEADVLNGGHEAIAASPNVVIQFEFSPKNLNTERKEKLLTVLRKLQAEGMAIWHLGKLGRSFTCLPPVEDDLPTDNNGNLLMVRQGSAREARLRELASRVITRPSLVTTQVEEALISALRQLLQHNKAQKFEYISTINDLRGRKSDDAAFTQLRPAQGLSSRPFELARMTSLVVVLRVAGDDRHMAETIEEARAFCGKRKFSVIVADARPQGEPLSQPSDAMLIAPLMAPGRWGRATLAALRAAEASHVLLIDAGTRLKGSLDDAMAGWLAAAALEQRVAGLAFAEEENDGTQIQEDTLGGFLAVRQGLFALAPLRGLAVPTDLYEDGGFDLDLSLRLWNAGFTIAEAPRPVAVCPAGAPLGCSPLDQTRLMREWAGRFTHPHLSDMFKMGGRRQAVPQ